MSGIIPDNSPIKRASISKQTVDFPNLTYLIIDDISSMRSSMRITLSNLGGTKIDMAGNGVEAIDKLEQRVYDIILCDYDLRSGKDGQQLLEEVRRRKLIKHTSLFVMVTAERDYEKVVSAAEFAPDDYLIKPFTAEAIELRLERLMIKKAFFAPVYDLMDKQDYRRAVQACDILLKAPNNPYKVDLMRLKAEICLLLGDHVSAKDVYGQVLAMRDVPWAQMGLGKACLLSNHHAEAAGFFQKVIEASPNYMEAYDWLAKALAAAGDNEAAQAALVAASEKSPRILHRRKTLGEIAMHNNDLETAQASFNAVLEFGKATTFISPEDFANLSRVLIEKNECDAALTTMKSARKLFRETPEALLQYATIDCLAHQKAGDKEAAEADLKKALEQFHACKNAPANITIDITSACFQLGDEENGQKIVENFIKNHHDDQKILKNTEEMFAKIGLLDKGKEIIGNASQEVVTLNNQAIKMGQAGDMKGAIELLVSAVNKYQGNTAIILNATYAILAHMKQQGWDEELGKKAKLYLDTAHSRDPENQRYLVLSELFKEVSHQKGAKP